MKLWYAKIRIIGERFIRQVLVIFIWKWRLNITPPFFTVFPCHKENTFASIHRELGWGVLENIFRSYS
jgi:hypothetical protein